MLHLENRELRLDVLDPAADAARQGARYCWGGYLWQVHDQRLGPLVAGPEFPHPTPSAFNGQGLPESFRHRTRDGRPLTWTGNTGLGIGIGVLTAGADNSVTVTEPCAWTVSRFPDQLIFQTRQAAAGFAYELTRKVELTGREVGSFTQLTNVGDQPLALQWFAHPFWALTAGRARVHLPPGTALPANPGFALGADGLLTFQRAFLTPQDDQFALLTPPAGRPLALHLDHPRLPRVDFTSSFAPDECPVWANARTVSVEPYLHLRLAPGETRHWHVRHGFAAPS
jgi:hypothetical protein